VAILRFSGGLDAHVLCSWIHPVKEQRLIVIGERGAAVFDDTLATNKLVWHDLRVEWTAGVPALVRHDPVSAQISAEEPLRRECTAFLTAIETGSAPVTDAISGLRVMAVLEACGHSMEESGAWCPVETP
jgi:UDP-2-acetamido-3-amino-2,3-dideoxy-glucuronate N-acetyltransferase